MRIKKEPLISAAILLAAWQVAGYFFPPFLFPSITSIARDFVSIFSHGDALLGALATAARILAGAFGAFVVGGAIGILMGMSPRAERYLHPWLTFDQGIPALSWVVISVIWFKTTEFRIWFIILVTTLPAFAFEIHDAYLSMSKDLAEMALSFRPSRWDRFRTLVIPSILPGIFTAWKVNLGNTARVVVVAELVGASTGVGYELLQRQQLFDMSGAIAWTMVLVVFVVVSQHVVALLENAALRYRSQPERGL